MARLVHVFTLLAFIFYASCKGKTDLSKNTIKSRIRDTATAYGPTTMVRNVKQGKHGTILIAASFGGVFRYDGNLFTNLATTIGSRRFWDVLEDRRGKLWISSTDSGVYYYNGKSFQHFTTRDGLPSNAVGPIYEDIAGIIWFGTGGGVSRYDGKSFRSFTTKDGLTDNDINTIMEDKTGKLWFGTRGYLSVYDKKTFSTLLNKDGNAFYNVWSIIEDRKGNIWFGGSIINDRKRTSEKGSILTADYGL